MNIKPEDMPNSLMFTKIEGTNKYTLNKLYSGIVSASNDVYTFDGLNFYLKDKIAVFTEEETKKYHSGVAEYNKVCDQIREELAADEPELDDDLKEITAHDEPKTMPNLNTDHFMRDWYDPMVKIKEKEFKETWHQKTERDTLEKMKKDSVRFEYSDGTSPVIIDGVYQFDRQKLERLNKLQTPTDKNPKDPWTITYTSEAGISVGNRYYTVVDEDGVHSCDFLTFEIYGQLVKLGRVYGK